MSVGNWQERLLTQISAEKARRLKENPTLGYKPFLTQEIFHRDKCRNRWLITGNRYGKTTAGAVEAVWWSTGTHPYRKAPTPSHGWIVSLTNDVQRDVAQDKLLQYLPTRLIARKLYRQRGVLDLMTLTNGSTIGFKTAEQKREKFQGTSRDWAWLDEEMPIDIFRETLTRTVDKQGSLWCTMTPVEGMSWTYDEVVCHSNTWKIHPSRWKEDHPAASQLPVPDSRKTIHVFSASIHENTSLSPQAIEEFTEQIPDEQEKRSRLHGEYTYQAGRIYQEWDRSRHLTTDRPLHKDAEHYVGIDTGRCFAAAFVAVEPDGSHYVYDGVYEEGGIMKDHSHEIMRRCYEYEISPLFYVDASSQFKDELADHGIYAYDASRDLLGGINRLRRLMRDGKFFVHSRMAQRWCFEAERYIWDDWRGAKKYSKSPKQRPRKIHDHLLDAVRYIVSAYALVEPGNAGAPKTAEQRIRQQVMKRFPKKDSFDLGVMN